MGTEIVKEEGEDMEHLSAELGLETQNWILSQKNNLHLLRNLHLKRGTKVINKLSVVETQQKLMMRLHQICSRVGVRHIISQL